MPMAIGRKGGKLKLNTCRLSGCLANKFYEGFLYPAALKRTGSPKTVIRPVFSPVLTTLNKPMNVYAKMSIKPNFGPLFITVPRE
jgi:hypothetical protein